MLPDPAVGEYHAKNSRMPASSATTDVPLSPWISGNGRNVRRSLSCTQWSITSPVRMFIVSFESRLTSTFARLAGSTPGFSATNLAIAFAGIGFRRMESES